MRMKTIVLFVLAGLGAVFGLIQLVPYGRDHTNPPVVQEPNWYNDRTRELVARACFDCHSNETVWPWYSNVAPISWLVYHDVEEGRETLNYSEWGNQRGEAAEPEEGAEAIERGQMPPQVYLTMHPEARLSNPEQQELIQGLFRTR
jgi:hypothetical protein